MLNVDLCLCMHVCFASNWVFYGQVISILLILFVWIAVLMFTNGRKNNINNRKNTTNQIAAATTTTFHSPRFESSFQNLKSLNENIYTLSWKAENGMCPKLFITSREKCYRNQKPFSVPVSASACVCVCRCRCAFCAWYVHHININPWDISVSLKLYVPMVENTKTMLRHYITIWTI